MKKGEVVLVVDEDPRVRDLARDILELFGHTVLFSETRDHAFSLCNHLGREITLMLLDSSGSAARDIYEKITTLNPDVRIIVTGRPGDGSFKEAVFAKARAFLQKPYRMSQLMLTIEQVQTMN